MPGCRQRSSRPVEHSPQLNRTATPTRKFWLGAISTRLSRSILLVSLLAAVPAAAANCKDAGGDVVMCDVNGALIGPPEEADHSRSSTTSWRRSCSIFVEKREPRRPSAGKSTWRARRQLPKRQQSCKRLRQKSPRRVAGSLTDVPMTKKF